MASVTGEVFSNTDRADWLYTGATEKSCPIPPEDAFAVLDPLNIPPPPFPPLLLLPMDDSNDSQFMADHLTTRSNTTAPTTSAAATIIMVMVLAGAEAET